MKPSVTPSSPTSPQSDQGLCPWTPVGGAAPDTPFAGLCPAPRPKGFALWKPRWGLCPHRPQQGRRPWTPQGSSTLDPSPQALTGLGDFLIGGFSFVYCPDNSHRRGLRRGPGGDRKAPWLLWGKRATGIGLDAVQSFVQGEVSPSRATKGLSDRPLETFGVPSLV